MKRRHTLKNENSGNVANQQRKVALKSEAK